MKYVKKWSLPKWAGVLGLLAPLLLACSGQDEPTPSAPNVSVQTADDGTIQQVTKLTASGAPSADEGAPAPADADKSGCTHIQYCNAPGPDEVICITNDKSCTRQARLNECFSDADYVCGSDWNMMRFSPPI
jgi:hypothetical protein